MGASAIDFWVWPIPEEKKQGIDDLNKILSGGTSHVFRLNGFHIEVQNHYIHCPKNHGISSHWWFGDFPQTPLLRKNRVKHSPLFFGGSNHWFSHAKFKEESGSSRDLPRLDPNMVRAFGPFWNKKGAMWSMWVCDGGSGDAFSCSFTPPNVCGTSKPSSRRMILTLTLAEFDGAVYTLPQRCTYILSEPKLLIFRWAWGWACKLDKIPFVMETNEEPNNARANNDIASLCLPSNHCIFKRTKTKYLEYLLYLFGYKEYHR